MAKVRKAPVQKGYLGADPELFITKKGKVIGSEKVITETNGVVEDGIQVELHPAPHYCREVFSHNISSCLHQLGLMVMERKDPTIKVSGEVLHKVSKAEYNSLKEKNKQFGCGISYNAHDIVVGKVDPSVYLYRTAGGHMHFGSEYMDEDYAKRVFGDPKTMVTALDIVVGNTCVLLDRDAGNIERRKHYGLAGEYRLPKYGLEYRTLSNFWLRSEALVSFVFGLARRAQGIVASGQADALFSLVNIEDIVNAINNNDFALANSNWNKYKNFLVETSHETDLYVIRNEKDVEFFEHIVGEGIDRYFSKDIITNWSSTRSPYCYGGWNNFEHQVKMFELQQERARNG